MTALLQSVPGGPELLIVLFIGTLLLVVPLAVSVYIYKDASGRNSDHALAWALGSFLTAFLGGLFGGIVVWILYFVVRDEIGSGGGASGAGV